MSKRLALLVLACWFTGCVVPVRLAPREQDELAEAMASPLTFDLARGDAEAAWARAQVYKLACERGGISACLSNYVQPFRGEGRLVPFRVIETPGSGDRAIQPNDGAVVKAFDLIEMCQDRQRRHSATGVPRSSGGAIGRSRQRHRRVHAERIRCCTLAGATA